VCVNEVMWLSWFQACCTKQSIDAIHSPQQNKQSARKKKKGEQQQQLAVLIPPKEQGTVELKIFKIKDKKIVFVTLPHLKDLIDTKQLEFKLKPVFTNFYLTWDYKYYWSPFQTVYKILETRNYKDYKQAGLKLKLYLNIVNIDEDCYLYFNEDAFEGELKKKNPGKTIKLLRTTL
jgi:hypothetical protein